MNSEPIFDPNNTVWPPMTSPPCFIEDGVDLLSTAVAAAIQANDPGTYTMWEWSK